MTSPYATKTYFGKSLNKRIVGKQFAVSPGPNNLLFAIPFNAVKLTGAEIINGSAGDKCDFKVLDKAEAPTLYGGPPNTLLNQFGFDVNIPDGFYSYKSTYPADLVKDLQILIVYNSVDSKTVSVNYIMDELL